MRRSRALHYFLCLTLFFSVLSCFGGDQVVLAMQESGNDAFLSSLNQEPPPEGKLEVISRYPTFEGRSGDSFEFEVGLTWSGSKTRTFDLAITEAPPRWNATIVAGYPTEKTIFGITLEPLMQYPETVTVRFAPAVDELPEPGEYVAILEASSDDIKETIKLTAVVTALYRLAFYTPSGRLNAEVTAGQENHLSVEVANTGTAPINKIGFTSGKPSGWNITFNPDNIDSLAPGMAREVDAIIEPPDKTIAGDYMVTMKAFSDEATFTPRDLELRVTALTPTIWGWVGVIIVLVVIAGLGVMFRRLGRR